MKSIKATIENECALKKCCKKYKKANKKACKSCPKKNKIPGLDGF